MATKKKYIITGVLILIIILVGAFFIYNYSKSGSETEPAPQEYTPEGEVSQSVDNPEVVDNGTSGQVIDNSDLSSQLNPTDEMKQVISDNKNDLNNADVIDQITPSYPSNVVPLYKASAAADSNDIITQNGNPGWIAQYGSDATVPEIFAFYNDLLQSTSGYSTVDNSDSKVINGTVDNCSVQVTISPNNPERTGLNNQSNVDIYIERN